MTEKRACEIYISESLEFMLTLAASLSSLRLVSTADLQLLFGILSEVYGGSDEGFLLDVLHIGLSISCRMRDLLYVLRNALVHRLCPEIEHEFVCIFDISERGQYSLDIGVIGVFS